MKDEGGIFSVIESNNRFSIFEGKRGRLVKKFSDNITISLYYLLASINSLPSLPRNMAIIHTKTD